MDRQVKVLYFNLGDPMFSFVGRSYVLLLLYTQAEELAAALAASKGPLAQTDKMVRFPPRVFHNA